MTELPPNEIAWSKKVRTLRDAARFVDTMGFCVMFPVRKVPLPSLYYAVRQGKKKFEWDVEIEKLWGWKDELPKRRLAFYAKYFRTRGTLISLKFLPYFLADRGAPTMPGESERYYAAGQITHDAKVIWQALAKHGSMATLELRHACKFDSKAGNLRYKKAMLELQCLLAVVHLGTEKETGAWASGKFELTSRAFLKQTAAARRITPEAARRTLAAQYRKLHPDAPVMQLARLFGWSKSEVEVATRNQQGKN